jgi:hypothetical protein
LRVTMGRSSGVSPGNGLRAYLMRGAISGNQRSSSMGRSSGVSPGHGWRAYTPDTSESSSSR